MMPAAKASGHGVRGWARIALAGGAVAVLALAAGLSTAGTGALLRVCSDPNNLPFSNASREGFENAIAELLADDLGVSLTYTWWPQRRGFLRNTLDANACDVVIGYPAGADAVRTTAPYYRSSYVFVTRRATRASIRSYDDPALRRLRVGVPLVGDDGASSPPGYALGRRGIFENVIGYSIQGDYAATAPPSAIVAAVAAGEIDVAVAWGPLAGFFAGRSETPLDVVAVAPAVDDVMPQTFAIAMAVRRDDAARQQRLNRFLAERRTGIEGILTRFHVPVVRP